MVLLIPTIALLLPFLESVSCSTVYPSKDASTTSCTNACISMSKALPGRVTTAQDAAKYQTIRSGYYTTFNSELSPACFVLPATAEEVAVVVNTAKKLQCPFAVKGGGHTFFAGANSIQDSISIDLQSLNQVTPNSDGIASVGPGNRWEAVYQVLDPLGKTVMGGRVATVGVGGLLVSGGISFLHPQHGFGCDNIRSYQIVNADGKILEVNQKSHPDLYWALRGGGNNFGIVTRFDLDTVTQGDFWGGAINYNITQLDNLLAAFNRLAQPETQDIKATTWFAPVLYPKTNVFIINVEPVYADPVTTTPAIFKPFLEAPDQLRNSIRIANLSSLTLDTNPVAGNSMAEWNIVMKMNTDVVRYVKSRIEQGALNHPLLEQIAFPVQILGKSGLSHTENRGGNALGLIAADGPLLIVQLSLSGNASTASPADDETIITLGEALMADVKNWSEQKGLAHRYIYMNYAGRNQDVFAGYGKANQESLRRVAKKYDPESVFQRLLPGGKKLF